MFNIKELNVNVGILVIEGREVWVLGINVSGFWNYTFLVYSYVMCKVKFVFLKFNWSDRKGFVVYVI